MLQRALQESGWQLVLGRDADGLDEVVDIELIHEKETGDTFELVPQLAPFVEPGSYVELDGAETLRLTLAGRIAGFGGVGQSEESYPAA